MQFLTVIKPGGNGDHLLTSHIIPPTYQPENQTGQGKVFVKDCDKVNKNFWHINWHTPSVAIDGLEEIRTKKVISLIKRGIPPATAEAIAFAFYGNPLEEGEICHG